jgi:N-acetylglucosaminyldiphosphoundecaprenol N-acetyl-beta-D-mannosaminyltransferase
MEAYADPEFRDIQNNSLLTAPDGSPTVWIGRIDGFNKMKRVRGADFMLRVCESSVKSGTRHFLYGGKPGVAELLRDVLTLRFPGLQIVGTYTPPFRPLNTQEEVELHQQLLQSKADILWCGIGCPKQERFMARYIGTLPVRLMVGVGAAFDLNAGLLKDSPEWVQKCGLQWAHRLWQEPRRLWRRYLLSIPRFIWLYSLQRLGVHAYELPPPCNPLHSPSIAAEGKTTQPLDQLGEIAA